MTTRIARFLCAAAMVLCMTTAGYADSTLLNLPPAGTLTGTETLYGIQGQLDRRITATQLAAYANGLPLQPSAVMGVPVGSMTWHPPGTGSVVKNLDLILNQALVSADSYGADPTGTNDSAPAFNNAIAQANQFALNGSGRATVFYCGSYKLASTVTQPNSGVFLLGCGADGSHDAASVRTGSTLFWNGASGGTMVSFSYPGGSTVTKRQGGGISNTKLDGIGVAGTVLDIASWSKGSFDDLTLFNPRSGGVALWARTLPVLAEATDTQFNTFNNIVVRTKDVSGSTATGILLDANSSASATGNTSFNTFTNIDVITANGPSIDCRLCDNNRFMNTRTAASGTGIGVALRASSLSGATFGGANGNSFFGLSSPNGVLSEGTNVGTYAAVQNRIFDYDTTNGSPVPTVGPGSTLSVINTDPQWATWTPAFGACTPSLTPPTFTNVEARYKKGIDATVAFKVTFLENAKNTGSGCVTFTLPTTPNSGNSFYGRESNNGYMLVGSGLAGSAVVKVYLYNAADPNVTGDYFSINGTYENRP